MFRMAGGTRRQGDRFTLVEHQFVAGQIKSAVNRAGPGEGKRIASFTLRRRVIGSGGSMSVRVARTGVTEVWALSLLSTATTAKK